jgi:hypothetical protein
VLYSVRLILDQKYYSDQNYISLPSQFLTINILLLICPYKFVIYCIVISRTAMAKNRSRCCANLAARGLNNYDESWRARGRHWGEAKDAVTAAESESGCMAHAVDVRSVSYM